MLLMLGLKIEGGAGLSAWTAPDGGGWELRTDGLYHWLVTPFAAGQWVRVADPIDLQTCVAFSLGWARSTQYRDTLERFVKGGLGNGPK